MAPRKTSVKAKTAAASKKIRVSYGGWYQRTTLHLSEIYDFFSFGTSHLPLLKSELERLWRKLSLAEVSRESGYLEFISAKTASGITIRYYEDGLYMLESEVDDISEVPDEKRKLEEYYAGSLSPAISYIFSLGAPTPKVLANIKTVHPTVIVGTMTDPSRFNPDEIFGPVYSKLSSPGVSVVKTPLYIFVMTSPAAAVVATPVVENLVFFREFKDHLEKYLDIHRTVWEEISEIKERKDISGTEVDEIRGKLDGYQKTISLISNRINQMGSYVKTRSSIAKSMKVEEYLIGFFQFKFETLIDTLDYIKEIWKMTSEYLTSSITNLQEIKNQSAARGIQSLQLITSLGVVSGILGYLSKNEVPKMTFIGTMYFAAIILVAWGANKTISHFYLKKRYNLKFGRREENI
ncbi:MAG: hypothetical protein PHG66_05105 [Candidatus Colwellbacteria bacterium]|nr:hypothetical protein [Candidatus Colwellbacteria bacterium]